MSKINEIVITIKNNGKVIVDLELPNGSNHTGGDDIYECLKEVKENWQDAITVKQYETIKRVK